jgi:hypothetical protein
MDSGLHSDDIKPKRNTVLNLALAICFSGLFFIIVGTASALAVLVFGGKTITSNLSYLIAVSLYLGMIVIALVGVMYSFTGSDTENLPAEAKIRRPRR